MFEKFWKALDRYEFKIRFLDKLNDPESAIYLGKDNDWNNFFRVNPNWIKENSEIAEKLISCKLQEFRKELKKIIPTTNGGMMSKDKKSISLKLEIDFDAKIEIKKDPVGFVSFCPAIDLWSQGDTEEEAEKNINEALFLFLESVQKMGTLDSVLKDCGFILLRARPLKFFESKGIDNRIFSRLSLKSNQMIDNSIDLSKAKAEIDEDLRQNLGDREIYLEQTIVHLMEILDHRSDIEALDSEDVLMLKRLCESAENIVKIVPEILEKIESLK